jgi:hypothetical protein
MNKVIADVLENISFESNLNVETKLSRYVADHHPLEPRSMIVRHPRRTMKTPIAKSLDEKKTIFGSVRVHTRRYNIERQKSLSATDGAAEDEESVSWVTVRPAPWVVAAGFRYGLKMTFWQTTTSWKHSLQTFRPVPNDAEIFKNVQWDDEETVWDLISQGKASMWDMNDVGRTPLMVILDFITQKLVTHRR